MLGSWGLQRIPKMQLWHFLVEGGRFSSCRNATPDQLAADLRFPPFPRHTLCAFAVLFLPAM